MLLFVGVSFADTQQLSSYEAIILHAVTKTITREYPVEVPAYNIATMKLTLYKYDMDVDYIATCVGKISGKEIKIKGRW